MKPHIVVLGSLNMDLVIRSPRIPAPGETIIGGEFMTIPGGKGANQAVAAARLGAQVSMIGRLGQDAFADQLLENLAAAGVNADHVRKDEGSASGVALIVVDDDGENSIVVASGANMRLTPDLVQDAAEMIAGADALVTQLEVPLPAVMRAAQIASQNGVRVVLNPAPARELPQELFGLVDVLVPNETETAILSGREGETLPELEQAAAELLAQGVGWVVITLGKRGALLASQDQSAQHFEAFSIDPVDTTAAGDAFVAGLTAHLAAGHSMQEAVRWGNAAGALAAMRFGAQTSLPTRDEVARLISGENADMIIREEI
jgi:ribokinase